MELSLLREHVSEVLGAECNLDRIRRNAGEEGRFEKDFRALVGELGWVAMCVPQELGGLGTRTSSFSPSNPVLASPRASCWSKAPTACR